MSYKNTYFNCPGCNKNIKDGPDHIYYSGNGYTQIIINRYKYCKFQNLPINIDSQDLKETLFLTLPKRDPPDLPFENSLPSNNLFIDSDGRIIKNLNNT